MQLFKAYGMHEVQRLTSTSIRDIRDWIKIWACNLKCARLARTLRTGPRQAKLTVAYCTAQYSIVQKNGSKVVGAVNQVTNKRGWSGAICYLEDCTCSLNKIALFHSIKVPLLGTYHSRLYMLHCTIHRYYIHNKIPFS